MDWMDPTREECGLTAGGSAAEQGWSRLPRHRSQPMDGLSVSHQKLVYLRAGMKVIRQPPNRTFNGIVSF